LIRKKCEDELDETPLLAANLSFGDEHLMAGEEGRARVGQRYGDQTHSHGRFPGRLRPLELSLGLPACTRKTTRSQEKQGCSPVPHPEANYPLLGWICHIRTEAHAECKKTHEPSFSEMLVSRPAETTGKHGCEKQSLPC
jgi:hypothetical protein